MSKSDPAKPQQKIETQSLEGFDIVGISTITCNKDGKAAGDINALWERFMADDLLHKIDGRIDNVIYCAYSDYEGDHTMPYRVTLGCKVAKAGANDLGGSLYKTTIPAGDYTIFAARGEQPKALLQTWEGVWKSNLPRTYKCDLEIYGPRFFEDGVHEVLVCVGVKV